MCIIADEHAVVKNGQLKLWKMIRSDNRIGIWADTYDIDTFQVGINVAKKYVDDTVNCQPGQFHCFFSRKATRRYMKFYRNRDRYRYSYRKIIRVYVDSKDVVRVGVDKQSRMPAVSVSKMTIRSLKHQR